MENILGIVSYTNPANVYVRGLSNYRPVAAFSYVGRYRLVDIPISNMTNSGIQDIQVYTNGDPRVLFDHIGSARHYNINNKHGHIGIVPVWANGLDPEFVSDMAMYYNSLDRIEDDTNEYVIIAPVNWIYKANYAELLKAHKQNHSDISVVYHHVDKKDVAEYLGAYCVDIDTKKGVHGFTVYKGSEEPMDLDVSIETYIMSKEVFVSLINKAHEYSPMFWLTDTLNTVLAEGIVSVKGIAYNNPVFPILNLTSYFHTNMKMLDERNMTFFSDPNWPIYTRTNDSPPTIYVGSGTSCGALISNGCEIAGTVNGSILGRGVKVGKGARVENSLILPGAEIGEGAILTNVIMDKDAKVVHKLEQSGYEDAPLYLERRRTY